MEGQPYTLNGNDSGLARACIDTSKTVHMTEVTRQSSTSSAPPVVAGGVQSAKTPAHTTKSRIAAGIDRASRCCRSHQCWRNTGNVFLVVGYPRPRCLTKIPGILCTVRCSDWCSYKPSKPSVVSIDRRRTPTRCGQTPALLAFPARMNASLRHNTFVAQLGRQR